MMAISDILQKCNAVLGQYYGSAFKGLVVYGSAARKQDTPQSDVDLLILLNGPLDYFRELRRIIDMLYPVQLESDRLISAKPASWEDFERGIIPLYRAAKKEGIRI